MKYLKHFLMFLVALLLSYSYARAADNDDPLDEQPPEIHDPFESINRGIFDFNYTLDIYVLEPVAKGYDNITPDRVQIGIRNFFRNIFYPTYLLSDLVKFNFTDAGEHTARFLINSTIGLLGTVDVARDWGMEHKDTDFGVALASHDVPAGPYIVIPFLGPSNLRDVFGKVVDAFVDPFNAVTYTNMSSDAKLGITVGARALYFVDKRAGLLDAIKSAKESSLDYYLFSQTAYYQYREGLLKEETSNNSQEKPEENE